VPYVCIVSFNLPWYRIICVSYITKPTWIRYHMCISYHSTYLDTVPYVYIVSLNLPGYGIICVYCITQLTWMRYYMCVSYHSTYLDTVLYVCIVSLSLPGYGINIQGVACMTLFRTSVLALNDRLVSLSENTPNCVHITHTIHIMINVIKIWNKRFNFRG